MTKAAEPRQKKQKIQEREATGKKKDIKPANNNEAKNTDETKSRPKDADVEGPVGPVVPNPEAAEANWSARSWPETYATAAGGPDSQDWQSSSWWGWGYQAGHDDGWANHWHGSWRRRRSSWESEPGTEAVETPQKALRRSNTSESDLDSGVVEALERLRTFDRIPDLVKLAQDLETKFAQAATPSTKVMQSESTTPGSTPSPNRAGSAVTSPTEGSEAPAQVELKPAETPAAEVKSQADQGQEPKPEASQIVPTQAAEEQKQEAMQASDKEDKKDKAEESKDPEATKPQEDEGKDAKQGTDEDKKQEELTAQEQKKADELIKRKKAAHARYMRYYRSVRGLGLGRFYIFCWASLCFAIH